MLPLGTSTQLGHCTRATFKCILKFHISLTKVNWHSGSRPRHSQGQEQGRASPGPRPGPARILPDFREDRARQARGISKKQEDRARPGFAFFENEARRA